MALNRRTLLLGLVVLVVGAGIIGGTGAFSSVQADRTVKLNTTGDSGALLEFSEFDPDIATTASPDSTGGVPVLQVKQTTLNADAKTVFVGAFSITNNGDENIDQLYIEENASAGIKAGGLLDFRLGGADGPSMVGNEDALADANMGDLGPQGKVTVTVVIDTSAVDDQNNPYTYQDLQNIDEITIVAQDTDADGIN